ncbi:hybrid sensor histidine kinase/response regulator [Pannus brasiliensis CCIBt3594]|uniref:histidine kinase n=1 Tax=Pannus brasiliensis CCIBt3594 TaxID=1427578 RepID=A0AAW9QUG7_9CHRO
MNTEQEMRLQFLDEAEEYIDTIETGILTLDPEGDWQKWDTVLRAAHSIKGGAAMMGYQPLSDMAHHLEDFFKIIKATRGQSVDSRVEADLLQGLDCSRRGISLYRNGTTIDPVWVAANFDPLLDRLRGALGELNEEIENDLLAADAGEDMAVFLFQTEVESCLERLEGTLSDPDNPIVREEFRVAMQELGGLGEMLELPNFASLCASIEERLTLVTELELIEIARLALQELQRARALVLIGQREAIPTGLEVVESFGESIDPADLDLDFTLDTLNFIDTIDGIDEPFSLPALEESDLAFFDELPDELPLETLEPAGFPEPEIPVAVNTEAEAISLADFPAEGDTADNITRVPTRQLEQLGDLVNELTLDRNSLNLQLSTVRSLFALLGQRVSILGRANQSLRDIYDRGQEELRNWGNRSSGPLSDGLSLSRQPAADSFDRLEMDRYSDLHSILQELMETIVQIQEVTGDIDTNIENTRRTAQDITRSSRILQDKVTRVRLRPFSDLVGRFPRVAREMSVKYGKPVHLKIIGGDTPLDRSILDALGDPLVHLLRNAFDHGIEDPDTRERRGKPREGQIEISATYRGSQVVIAIRDDGGGIDPEKIAAKAMQMGFTAEDITKLDRQDLLNLIFEPGFSTASSVTELSGRGIGMDIVRTKVAALRGRLGIDTRPDEGTTITIAVPFSLSVLRVLLVESGGMPLAFPTVTIEEMLVATPEMRLVRDGRQFLDIDGDLLPLFNLREHFQFSRPFLKPESSISAIIPRSVVLIAAAGERLVGIEVDAYFGEQEVTSRAVEGGFPLPPGFDRCTILGDGRVVPLVSVYDLLEAIERRSFTIPFAERPVPVTPPSSKDLILVVDDSINVRRFLAATLEKAGYRVQQARDGQDAVEKLQDGLPVRAVICDIEMPRLDGFGFLAQVRARREYRDLPIFLLTSRSGEKHRQLAFTLGASGYFSKPFQEQELLQAIREALSIAVNRV